jgi:uncharacterized protein YlxW (UPF0749 family)
MRLLCAANFLGGRGTIGHPCIPVVRLGIIIVVTTEERFARIEHYTAGWAEERRKDREEFRMLWRETQRQLNELTLKIADTNDAITRMAEETQKKFDRLAEESRAADQQLRERIDSLVSAIGALLPKSS